MTRRCPSAAATARRRWPASRARRRCTPSRAPPCGARATSSESQTSGITVYGADSIAAQHAQRHRGLGLVPHAGHRALPRRWCSAASPRPRLGLSDVSGAPQVWIGGRYYTVVGILAPVTLDSGIDRAAPDRSAGGRRRTGRPTARRPRSTCATDEDKVGDVRSLAGRRGEPREPRGGRGLHGRRTRSRPRPRPRGRSRRCCSASAPSRCLSAESGIANVMVISVIERRSEIGLRRALGATRRHITSQFLTESLLLSAMGGVGRGAARRSRHGRLLDGPGPADRRPRRGRRAAASSPRW